jgi:hypothetical protein
MKEPGEQGQGRKPPQKKKQRRLTTLIFAKRDKKPATSSTTHALVENGRDYEYPSSDSTLIRQDDLELWLLRRREFAEIDERIAVALSKGAAVEYGVHTAELVAARAEDGSVHLKLVIR